MATPEPLMDTVWLFGFAHVGQSAWPRPPPGGFCRVVIEGGSLAPASLLPGEACALGTVGVKIAARVIVDLMVLNKGGDIPCPQRRGPHQSCHSSVGLAKSLKKMFREQTIRVICPGFKKLLAVTGATELRLEIIFAHA